jgi:hypothetical protein
MGVWSPRLSSLSANHTSARIVARYVNDRTQKLMSVVAILAVLGTAWMVAEDVFSDAIAASLISILLHVFIARAVFAWVAKKHLVPAQEEAAA